MNNWDLTKIYQTEEDFQQALKEVQQTIEKIASYKGQLGDVNKLKEYLNLSLFIEENFSKVFSYANMSVDLNKKDIKKGERLQLVYATYNQLIAQSSFEAPEILKLGEEYMENFFKANPDYEQFHFNYQKLFKGQTHVLDDKSEMLLSNFSSLLGESTNLYSALTFGDLINSEVTLSSGEKVTVTQGNWRNLCTNLASQDDRKKVFEAIFSYYAQHKNTYAEIYHQTVIGELSEMKARNYTSILQSHLEPNNIPEDVFHTLIDVVSSNCAPLHKYYEIRAKHLHLSKHRSYDRFLQLAKSDKKYTYEEAKEFFYNSIAKFTPDFNTKAREVTKEGYVDVYESIGKVSGAYSNGGSNMHPFILLNFDGALDDVFTLAHEAGHSIHTLYSMEAQKVMNQSYTIFVAEIASTFNEHNLLDYMMDSKDLSKEEKISLLQKAIDEIVSTFYRQTLFANFEYDIAKLVEQYQPINYEVLSNEMIKLYKTYYGIDIHEEEVKEYVWAYIPHIFNTPFYVYQYATSFTASMEFYQRVKNKQEGAFDQYISMLKSGGSDYPINQVKKAGVDLTKKEPYLAVVNRMETLVNQLEKLLED